MRVRHGLFLVVMLLPAARAAAANRCDVTSIEDCAVIRLVNETGELVSWTNIQGDTGPGLQPGAWEDRILQPESGRIGVDWFHQEAFAPLEQHHGWVSGVDECLILVVKLLPGGDLVTGGTLPKACRRDRLLKEAEQQAQAQREADERARLAKEAADRARLQKEAAAKAQQEKDATARQVNVTPTPGQPDPSAALRQRAAEEAAARQKEYEAKQAEAARLQREAVERERARRAAEAAKTQGEIDRRIQFSQDMAATEGQRNEQFMAEAESTLSATERRDRIQARAATGKAISGWKPPVKAGGAAGPLDLGDLGRTPTPTPTPVGLVRVETAPTPAAR